MGQKRTWAAALLLMLCSVSLRAADLDGTQWKMRFKSAKAWIPVWKADLIRFEGGRFRSNECASYGFGPASYGETARGGRKVWSSTLFNADGERTDWEGELLGDRMTGDFIWTRPDGHSRRYRFSASRRAS